MRSNKTVPINRYLYADGRIRALEIQMFDSVRLSRLYDAHAIEDVNRLLSESGYPMAADPETRLIRETEAVYQLMFDLFPEKSYIEAFMIFHDFHNLKVILKNLTPAWPRIQNSDAAAQDEDLPESAGPFSLVGPALLDPSFQHPSMVDPHVLFLAIRDRQPGQVPTWLYSAAVQSVRLYQQTYDISDIDLVLDRLAYKSVLEKASRLKNSFFSNYLQLRADLTNLGLLLRTRYLRSGLNYLEQALLPGGTIAPDRITELYQGTNDQIKQAYAGTPFAELAEMAEEYGQRGSAGRFSLLADNLIIEHIRQARMLWRGPEILLAYLIAREMEIKNVRIVLTCLRNGLPASQARELNRNNYLTWR